MARIDLAHVDARVVAELPFREKKERVEAEGIDVEREERTLLHELDRSQPQRVGKPREHARSDSPLARVQLRELLERYAERIDKLGVFNSALACERLQRIAECRAAGGSEARIPNRYLLIHCSRGSSPSQIRPSSAMTAKRGTLANSPNVIHPVCTLKRHACHGHVTTPRSTLPSASGPP